ncbi:hypothetical protein PHYSODRAFT_297828 [Phytophthora sojae]|uniref:Uncharacterized protein n=1 Tax=Phytophthora sojae (strain P6497) TaxID=1094619 RepID=G4ZAI1_PHYSP|nr:hypothetical protein PHYSODRAFT_297828 [Phytophthora sojae]EGZ19178.1 hypothetical protein PHYSODRAFT_297828 [Phytophthora sojae]|eukprot:XP_009521895.1 hypothetical protein PHYSODRAFT_297828 [Phytophthora sojae]
MPVLNIPRCKDAQVAYEFNRLNGGLAYAEMQIPFNCETSNTGIGRPSIHNPTTALGANTVSDVFDDAPSTSTDDTPSPSIQQSTASSLTDGSSSSSQAAASSVEDDSPTNSTASNATATDTAHETPSASTFGSTSSSRPRQGLVYIFTVVFMAMLALQ